MADATVALASSHTELHAASPVGQWPPTQSWAAPGAPLMPVQLHAQQPQSLAVVQAPPGGVFPGCGPVGPASLHAPATSTTSAIRASAAAWGIGHRMGAR